MLSSLASNKQFGVVELFCLSYLWIQRRGGAERAVISFSVTGNVICPSLITFFPLIRWWGGGWEGLSQEWDQEIHSRDERCWWHPAV